MSLHSKIIAHTDGNRIFWLMVSAVVLMAAFYVYSVNVTVVLVSQRNSIESKIAANQKAVTALESTYISGKSAITLELASNLGYGEAQKVVYMPKKAVSVLTRAETLQ